MEQADESPDLKYENMRMEVRIRVGGRIGRIKVLAANPRTARGFSGDLILDEFAFHENSNAIWEAAEPILSSNKDFLCRVASTGNGKHNMFYRMATSGDFKTSRISRSDAYAMGVKIFDPATRAEITPDQARKKALDKRAYDQNYECKFTNENMALLTDELISTAEREDCGEICEQDWTQSALDRFYNATGNLYVGVDVARRRDLTVITVIERLGEMRVVLGLLRIENMRLPDQKIRVGAVCRMPKFRHGCIDMTGLGVGLLEFAQDAYGRSRLSGIDFAWSVPTTTAIKLEGRKEEKVRVTEAMAMELLRVYEDKRIIHPIDQQLREELRKPERVVTPGGRVSIAATRDESGHADHFWSFALAIEAGATKGGATHAEAPKSNATRSRNRVIRGRRMPL